MENGYTREKKDIKSKTFNEKIITFIQQERRPTRDLTQPFQAQKILTRGLSDLGANWKFKDFSSSF